MDYLLGEKFFAQKMDNGLTTYVLPKNNFNKIYALYSTRYGSIDSEFALPDTGEYFKMPEGIAHFLEHKMFEMEYGNVFDKFAELGTSTNAFTSYTNTTYLFSTTGSLKENLLLLLDFVETPYFIQDSVEKEKGIITQELRMYQDDPNWQVLLNLLRCLYHNHPVRDDIGGTVESINKIDSKILHKCYKTFYHPSNMILFVAGRVEPEEVFTLVRFKENSKDVRPQGEIKRIYPHEPLSIKDKSRRVTLDVAEPLFLMGFKDTDVGYEGYELLKKEICTDILLEMIFGRSSVHYERLYEKGLIDDRFGFSYDAQKDYSFCTIGGETRDPDRLHEELISSITQNTSEGPNLNDFNRIKKKHFGSFVKGFNSIEFIGTSFISYHHKGINIFDYLKALEETTLEDVKKRKERLFDLSKHAVSIVLPKR